MHCSIVVTSCHSCIILASRGRESEFGQPGVCVGRSAEDGIHCLHQEDPGCQRTAQGHRDEDEGAVGTSQNPGESFGCIAHAHTHTHYTSLYCHCRLQRRRIAHIPLALRRHDSWTCASSLITLLTLCHKLRTAFPFPNPHPTPFWQNFYDSATINIVKLKVM